MESYLPRCTIKSQPTHNLTPQEKRNSQPKRQHDSLVSPSRHESVVLLGHRNVDRLGNQLRRDLARLSELVKLRGQGGKDGRRPTRRTEYNLETTARGDDECGCLVIKCYTTVSTGRSPPTVSRYPPKLYASGQTLLASRLYKPGLHTLGLLYFPVQQSAGWLYFAQAEKQGLKRGRWMLSSG